MQVLASSRARWETSWLDAEARGQMYEAVAREAGEGRLGYEPRVQDRVEGLRQASPCQLGTEEGKIKRRVVRHYIGAGGEGGQGRRDLMESRRVRYILVRDANGWR